MAGAVRRKAVIKSKPTVHVASMRELAGAVHLHFCSDRDCRLVYEDACDTPEANRRCTLCRTGRRGWTQRDPQECCIGNCKQILDREELNRYTLAGPGPWFQCLTCCRSHGWPCA